MSDLARELMSKLGAQPVATPAPAAQQEALPPALAPEAHLDTPWMAQLRAVRVPGAPPIPPRPSLNAARQLTDKAAKALKAAGKGRAASDLVKAREDFLGKRDKAAWSLVKARFEALSLSERAYRALKQAEADPEKVMRALNKTPDDDLRAMGADRLRELLS